MINITGQIISFCWLAFLLYWLGSFVLFPTKRTIEKQSFLWGTFPLIVLLVILALVQSDAVISEFLSHNLWPQTFITSVMADILCLIGLTIAIWARNVLGRNWSSKVVFKENHELVTTGPYAYVRHPIYAGLILLLFGTALYFGNLGSIIFFFLFSLFYWLRSRQEEQLMEKHFPDSYPSYKSQTKALIPFIL